MCQKVLQHTPTSLIYQKSILAGRTMSTHYFGREYQKQQSKKTCYHIYMRANVLYARIQEYSESVDDIFCLDKILCISGELPRARAFRTCASFSKTSAEGRTQVSSLCPAAVVSATPATLQARTNARTSDIAAAASWRADGGAFPRRKLSTTLAIDAARSWIWMHIDGRFQRSRG